MNTNLVPSKIHPDASLLPFVEKCLIHKGSAYTYKELTAAENNNPLHCIHLNTNQDSISMSYRRLRIGSRRSLRIKKWNYGSVASYFVTISVHDQQCVFGAVKDGSVELSTLGEIANGIWLEIERQFEFIELGEFCIMPNHLHGIIHIIESDYIVVREDTNKVQQGDDFAAQGKKGGITNVHNPMLYKNLARAIRWYKGRVTYEARKIDNFQWHRNYHEHKINSTSQLAAFQNYIRLNPSRWSPP